MNTIGYYIGASIILTMGFIIWPMIMVTSLMKFIEIECPEMSDNTYFATSITLDFIGIIAQIAWTLFAIDIALLVF